jgi:hypothetical protein
MKTTIKIALSIPSILLLGLIPYNFFADFSNEEFDLMIEIISVVQILFLFSIIFILYKLWKSQTKSTTTKWVWTILTILIIQPLSTLIYLWFVEPKKTTKK